MNETDEIKDRLPIEQVVGGYLPLKKAGRIYKACCPFHGEKTPSFTVSPDRGIYKCFGCGEGGDIFDFVMKMDGLTFPEALSLLAERAGVTLPDRKESRSSERPGGVGKERLFKLNSSVSSFWHAILIRHPKGEPARTYLEGRGVSADSIERFQIGYAPLGSVTNEALRKVGFSSQELSQAGEPGRFQDRIVFPICDIAGKPIGFTGRLLELPDDPPSQSSRGPKYWNTPETPLFIKSRALYAFHLAKQAIQKEEVAIMAEGQMDVILLHQYGYANTIASSGTALTADQVRMIGRFTDNLAFAYDQDKAGIEAVKRGAELVLAAGLNPFVITVPVGKDPAECLLKAPEQWEAAYKKREPFFSWLAEQVLRDSGTLTPVDKKEAAKQLLPWLDRLNDPLERREWLRWLSVRLQTEEENLQQALDRLHGGSQPHKPAAAETPSAPKEKQLPVQKDEIALALLLSYPSILPHVSPYLQDLIAQEPAPWVARLVPLLHDAAPDTLQSTLEASLSAEEKKQLSIRLEEALASYEEELSEQQALSDFLLIAGRLRTEAKEEVKQRLAEQIRLAQQMGDPAKLKELFSQLKNLI